jgi:hypothetical protein
MSGERRRSAATSVRQMRLRTVARGSSLTCRAPVSERSEQMNALFLNPARRHIRPGQAGNDLGENGGVSLFPTDSSTNMNTAPKGSVDSLLRHSKNSPTAIALSISDVLAQSSGGLTQRRTTARPNSLMDTGQSAIRASISALMQSSGATDRLTGPAGSARPRHPLQSRRLRTRSRGKGTSQRVEQMQREGRSTDPASEHHHCACR